MAKRNRGKTLNRMPSNARGNCPICGRKRIKLLYSVKMDSAQTVKVCKNCRAK
ncbi:hypothetical protein HMPREF9372_0905 [Sporosarcina newyorkensis 2681]|uniref:Uncharacterized protein n=1 Tax=Sporosarcina newyorkensis 2681 TaxID=1027292 RepID=F9DQ25_9BACL|nr:hypothetical protein HMPREF9372_0905 [Sporosarcina newyorkensis 2681]